jgi:hypothetical protein
VETRVPGLGKQPFLPPVFDHDLLTANINSKVSKPPLGIGKALSLCLTLTLTLNLTLTLTQTTTVLRILTQEHHWRVDGQWRDEASWGRIFRKGSGQLLLLYLP